jgi:anti-anti-sigma regulatory factor
MNTAPAKMSVLVGEHFACIKISGRANLNSSIDFKTLVNELMRQGYSYFVLDLSECTLMDSTFLGVLAGFGLRLGGVKDPASQPMPAIELLNANERITELLENLGVLHLFRTTEGPLVIPGEKPGMAPAPTSEPTREQVTRACLEAHQTLMAINPENVARFKDVAAFLAEDLKRLQS